MGKVIYKALLMLSAIASVYSQFNFYEDKPGSCPPPLPVQICSKACFVDAHCQGVGKCCPTSCGGLICSRPVTMRSKETEKPGLCPATPTGRWVCSPTCTIDSDCQGTKKCCKNRCGALACQKPDIDVTESVEISPDPRANDNDIHDDDMSGAYANNPFLRNDRN
ncbi:waprin-Phi1-like [Microplitis mediator]|uniref:waprin-Phi1-like n=1 Tax=Microplitis mediator TaxID=375433 RepID=UPI0025545D51|nr:waprin-Phi1-like [Microplitis mediator]